MSAATASFVARDDSGRKVRVHRVGSVAEVVAGGRVVGGGTPTVADGAWSVGALTLHPLGPTRTTALVWYDVGEGRTDGGTLVADRAVAELAGERMLWPTSTRGRGGVTTLSGLSEDGEALTWTLKPDRRGCGCGGGR